MTRSLRLGLAVVVFAAGCTRDLTLPQPPPTTAFVTGRVVAAVPGSSASAPVAGARIALLNSNLNATSDDRGQFILGPLPEGTYRLFFSSKAGTTTRQRIVTGVQVKPGATNSVGDVSLQENALLNGRALIQGLTSGNVGITVFSPGTDYVTTTADNGGWLLANLPEGSIRATAWRPGFAPATTTDITLQGGVVTSAVDLILEPEAASAPPGSITGRVVVIGHDDHAGVTVKAVSTQSREVRATATTTATGEFVLPNLSSDLYLVTLDLDGYPSARVPNLAVAGGVQLELVDPIIMALAGDGNAPSTEPIGGPSGPLYSLDGGQTASDGGAVLGSDGGTVGAECVDDNQCASGRRCIDNRCVGCSVNVQCRPGYSCQSGDCVRDCQGNAECPLGLACISGSCTTCLTSSDCRDPSLVCNPQSQCAHCRDRSECPSGKACLVTGCGDCTLDADCGSGAICEQGVCTPGDCHGNADCTANQACVGRSCGQCTVDSQCRAGQLCVGNACVTGNCRSVLDCGAGQVCLNNQCGACANDAQCGAGQLCLPGTNGLRCTAGTCRANGDCTGASAGMLCLNNTCQACGTSAPCANGQICNAQGRCVVGDCFTNADCTGPKAGYACLSANCTPCGASSDCGASGYVCVGGQCRVGNCASPADCPQQGQLCTNNACVGCTQSSQCPGGQVCDQGLCQAGNCTSTSDCTGGRLCLNRTCSQCTLDSQCGAGNLCLGGACTPGNCRTPTDCFVASADGGVSGTQLCTTNFCQPCANTTQCGANKVCDTNLCFPGNCLTALDCGPGQLCLNRTCSACTQDGPCGAGQLCLNGACTVANCRVPSDCAGSGDGGTQLCLTNSCAPCTGPGQCGAGKVCDQNFCFAGDCASNADCTNGRLCLNRTCTACTTDGQCGAGRICVSGGCVTGTCRNDSECSGGTQLCDLAAGPTQYTCRGCTPMNATSGTTCGAGRVCDSAGFCHFGNCLQNSNCGSTQVCTNFTCTSCTADNQCSGGKLCVNGSCLAGNCHGTGADPNVDCAATNGVCVSNFCVGNCRTSADCTASTGYCDQGTHLCSPCTGPGQCGVGKVCTPGGGGNTCVAAQCSSIEPNCVSGESCISGACVQYGPSTAYDGGGAYVEPGTFAVASGHPMPVSSRNTIYLSGWESPSSTGAGAYTLALEPNLSLRWRVRDSNISFNTAKTTFGGSGTVLPAPGFPMDELFLSNDSNGGAIAHRADTGATAWRIPYQPQAFAVGLVNGLPHVAWVSSSVLFWMRTDGTGLRQVTLTGCTWQAIAFGTRAIMNVCAEALFLVDPITATVKTVAHGGNPANVIGNGNPAPVTPLWRPPNDYVARGVNSGTVTSDIIVYMGKGGANTWMFAANIPDDWVTSLASTSTWAMWANTTSNFTIGTVPLTIDATGAVEISSGSTLYKVNLFTGAQLATTPMGTFSNTWNLASGGQFIDVATNSTLQGFVHLDNATTAPTSLWLLPNTPGNYLSTYPNFTADDHLLALQLNGSSQPTLRSFSPGLNAPSFVPAAPAWSHGGNPSNQNSAPGYECTTNTQCAATQTCILGRCTGQCRDATQCGAGLGCSFMQCTSCSTQASCRGGEVCWAGQCIACSGANCCNTSADCASSDYCFQGTCRAGPAPGTSGNFSVASAVTRTNPSVISVAPDGTLYVGDTETTNRALWRIISPTGTLLSTTPSVANTLGGAGQRPVALIAAAGVTQTLWHGAGATLFSAPVASSVSAWTQTPFTGFSTGFLRMGQGVSNVIGAARPTLFATIANGVSNDWLLAIDTAQAAVGGSNAGLVWKASLGGTCSVSSVGGADHLLIGSDGTVYVVCPDASVEAWAADGDPTTGPAPNRLGLLKWRSGPPTTWPSAFTGTPAIGKTPSNGDVIYIPRTVGQAGMAILNVGTATNGTIPLEVAVETSGGIVTDSQGRAIALGAYNAAHELAVVSPTGAVLFDDKVSWWPGQGHVLTADNQLIFSDSSPQSTSPRNLTAVTVANPQAVVQLYSLSAPGNLPLDTNSQVVVLSTSQTPSGLVGFDHPPAGALPRTFTGYVLPNSPGPMPNAWSTLFGDLQRRNSLKTQ